MPYSPKETPRRRFSYYVETAKDNATKVFLSALTIAIVFHVVLYFLCDSYHLGISLHTQPNVNVQDEEKRLIVNTAEEETPPAIDPTELPDEEIPHDTEIETPDIVDVDLDNVVVEPGETAISIPDVKATEITAPEIGKTLDMQKIKAGLPDMTPPDPAFVNNNPLTIKAANIDQIDVDEWYKDKLQGAGGKDDSHDPKGSKTLSQLLDQPGGSLGANSGYSRLGADLLFEYDKAELRRSAHVGLLQLAALMEKNPTTRFIIEGHTDSFGNATYNKKLSLLRAAAVRHWLEGNGIDLSRVYIIGCGAERPVVSTTGDKAFQAANRRVEIHMRKPSESLPKGCLGLNDPLPELSSTNQNSPIKTAEKTASKPTIISPAPLIKNTSKANPSSEDIPSAEIIETEDSSEENEAPGVEILN